ncbi:hypothetical protein [Bifidobacterium saguinibicoloris]|uniref:hypothetical protein n=1 Tax=Bifidobacterium saguinibicoloris TaxID=2834433 RepID=UPI001C5775F2|nr:hypothetical protein [Bifidobacterium saguinibicoloris]MBW3080276.1 hypothetical protein [Bifidobacterium saguinibicoloris]
MEARRSRPRFSANAFLTVANVVYLLLAMSVLTLIGCLPLVLAFVFAPGLRFYPLVLAAAALSAPGVAASFAMFRDHPVFLTASRRDALNALAESGGDLPDWIAAPYVPSDVSVAVFRPYFAAYRRVGLRALAVGVTFGVAEFLALYDAQLLMQVAWGQLFVPLLFVVAVISVEAALVALGLVVEFPKAKWRSLLRNGYLCGVRRFVMLVINACVLAVYAWGAMRSPILVAVLATGVVAFVLWAGVRWQFRALALAMAREAHDRHLVALYD